ncbi:MAG: TraR/DksA C4-type zinc finger protein [Gammaproteobacteria bacterium]|nr:TraR/DksA C4-type zinc finger protein [Gammaproteobacteria bacterium]
MSTQLTDEQRQALRQSLQAHTVALQEEIRSELRAADLHRAEDIMDRVRDSGDESVVDLLADIEYADIDRHIRELQANEAALRAWHDGRYGVCIDCDESIPYERLHAYPSALRCIRCQERVEHANGHPPQL